MALNFASSGQNGDSGGPPQNQCLCLNLLENI